MLGASSGQVYIPGTNMTLEEARNKSPIKNNAEIAYTPIDNLSK